MENVAGEQGLALQHSFLTNLTLLKFQTVIYFHSLMMEASNLAISIFWTIFFQFLAVTKLYPIIS